jgi:hypothetical protein
MIKNDGKKWWFLMMVINDCINDGTNDGIDITSC